MTYIANIPDYIWQELFHVIILAVSALIVAFATSWIFKRKDEVTRVEGVLLEKKLEVYRQLSDRLLNFEELHQLSMSEAELAIKQLEENDLAIPQFLHIPSFMLSGVDNMYEQLMAFDRFATENKIYYDDYTAWPIFVFQNYNTIFIRFHAMYRDGIVGVGFAMTEEVKRVEDEMFIALGLLICTEWVQRVENLISSLQTSVNNLNLSHRKVPVYNYQMMTDPNGPMMSELKTSILMQERDKIMNLITSYVALGLIAAGVKGKDIKRMNKKNVRDN